MYAYVSNGANIICLYDANNLPQSGDYTRMMHYTGTFSIDYPTLADNPSVTGLAGVDSTGFTISYSPNVSSMISRISYLAVE